jgi:TolB-like protein/tetratricopeptide (TPR) repeat protein
MVLRFDCFELDTAAGQLRKRGRRIRLRDQPLKILATLIEHRGEVVTRHDLQQVLWPDQLFVDFENNLNTAVARLRRALGDSSKRPRFVETLPRHGYRFLAQVSEEQPSPELSPPPHIRLIVLPFVNLSGDPGQEYFSDAMTEEVITELAALASDRLGVIARTTAMHFKGTHKDVAQIGRELGAAYVVEGGVRRDGDRLTVTAQLIRVSDQTHLFARRFDADLRSVFDIRSSIAEAVVDCLDVHAGAPALGEAGEPTPRKRSPVDLEAWNEFVQGRYLFDRVTPETMASAKRHFEAALELDPGFALAHDALAEFYATLGYFGFTRPIDAFSIGISHALAAVDTNPSLAEARAVLAEYHKQLDYSWAAAERQMARALELDPASPIVRGRHAVAILMPHNRIDEAISEIERALELDPLSAYMQTWLGVMLLLGRDYDRAIGEAGRLLELEPASAWAHFILGCAYRQKYADAALLGNPIQELADESIRAHTLAVELSPGLDFFLGWLGLALGVCGREAEAREVLARLQRSSRYNLPTTIGHVHLGLREIDAAFECFDRAVEERDQIMIPILSYAHFDPIRGDPRFAELLRKMKLA